jgi:hypothetical protein
MLPSFVHPSEALGVCAADIGPRSLPRRRLAEDPGEADAAPRAEPARPAAADPIGRAVASLAWLVLAGGTAAAVLIAPL